MSRVSIWFCMSVFSGASWQCKSREIFASQRINPRIPTHCRYKLSCISKSAHSILVATVIFTTEGAQYSYKCHLRHSMENSVLGKWRQKASVVTSDVFTDQKYFFCHSGGHTAAKKCCSHKVGSPEGLVNHCPQEHLCMLQQMGYVVSG